MEVPSPTTDRAAQQQTIRDAALRTIARRGYSGASLAAIAEEAGTTKRMVLYYFESRDQLLLELTEQIMQQMVELELGAAEESADSLGEGYAQGFLATWQRLVEDPVLLRVYVALLAEGEGDETLRRALEHVRAAHDEVFNTHIERARAAGIEPPTNPAVISIITFAAFRGLMLELLERGPSPELDVAVEFVANSFRGMYPG